jgi:hypothetical protein
MGKIVYIYAPAWAEWSAGTRVLHYLCHFLNLSGIESYLVLHGWNKGNLSINPKLKTPVLTKLKLESHHESQKEIWVIYSESVPGNPLRAEHVFRWLLNFPSLLGGQTFYPGERVLSYSKRIAEQYQALNQIQIETLFVPALLEEDAESLVALGKATPKEGLSLCYAQKFKNLGGAIPIQIQDQALEITRFGKSATSRKETLRLIASAQELFVFENSTVITEAQLLGTPVVCVKNNWFSELLAEEELGSEGVTWELETSFSNPEDTLIRIRNSWTELPRVINSIFNFQTRTERRVSPRIVLPKQRLFSNHAIARGRILLKQKGIKVTLQFARAYFFRRRPN